MASENGKPGIGELYRPGEQKTVWKLENLMGLG